MRFYGMALKDGTLMDQDIAHAVAISEPSFSQDEGRYGFFYTRVL